MRQVHLAWCKACRAWWFPIDVACPQCGKPLIATTPFQYEAAQMKVQVPHSATWHWARRRLGGTKTCDCGHRTAR